MVGYVIALAGGAVALVLGVPIPWLLGALLASLLLGVAGKRPTFPNAIRDVAFILLGYLIGSTASTEFYSSVTLWIPSVVVSVLLIPLITISSAIVVRRLTDLTAEEAMLCSVPGSLPFVVAASEDLGLRTPIVILFQSVRLLTLTFLLPFALSFWGGEVEVSTTSGQIQISSLTAALGFQSGQIWWQEGLVLVGSLGFAGACAVVAGRLNVPAPTFIGPMMGVAAAKLAGVPLPDLPPLLLIGSQAALGWIMGTRFDAIPRADVRGMAVACFAGLGVGLAVALLACGLLIAATGLDARALILGLAPGAIETVTSIALDQAVDPLFVSTHQIARMLSIPLIATGMLMIGRRLLLWVDARNEKRAEARANSGSDEDR